MISLFKDFSYVRVSHAFQEVLWVCSAVTGQHRTQAGLSLTSCDASKGPGAAYHRGNLSSQDVYGFIVCSYYLKTSIRVQFHKALHVKWCHLPLRLTQPLKFKPADSKCYSTNSNLILPRRTKWVCKFTEVVYFFTVFYFVFQAALCFCSTTFHWEHF